MEIEDDDALGLNTTDHFAYIVGYGNGEVRPQNNITRAEVATIFFRLLTDDVRDENLTKTNRYSDVAATAWYNTAVSTLSSMGIITGYPDGTFRPNAAITRAEFAAIAARFDHDGDKTAAKFSDIALSLGQGRDQHRLQQRLDRPAIPTARLVPSATSPAPRPWRSSTAC